MNCKHNRYFSSAFFILLSFFLLGCDADGPNADIILMNGKIVTVDKNFSIAEAIAIQDGKILRVGDQSSVMNLAGDSTAILDLKGHTVIPGLIDGHAHPISSSQSEYVEPIPDVRTTDDVLAWVETQAKAKADNEWIVHPKFFITRMRDMKQLTREQLDAAAPDNPVFLNGSYGGIVNTKALALSKMLGKKHPGILTDNKTGKPTGLIRKSAFSLLAIPKSASLSADQKAELLKEQLRIYNSIGITSACSGGGTIEELEAFRELMNRGELTVRIYHNIRIPLDLKRPQEEITRDLKALGLKTGDGNEWVKVGALKVILDGGMLTGTAWLHEGWGSNARDLYGINDPDYRGELFIPKEDLIKIVDAATDTGWKFTAHVTGGAGVDTLISAYEIVNRSKSIRGRRYSVIHGNFFTDSAIAKMADMEVYADMQPAWFFEDTDLLHHVLGSERIKTFHPYQSLIKAGVVVNGGSDHMVKLDPNLSINPYNPFTAMWSVVTRRTDRGTVFNPEQAVSREEALKMYTINNAYASFEENIKGSIEAGKLADLVVLTEDILTCPEESIRRIRPVLTMVDGKAVFDSGTLQFQQAGLQTQ